MPIKRFDKTEQLATGVGTAALTLTTATTGNRTYAAAGAEQDDQFWARIEHETLPAEWEICLVTVVGGTIVRSAPKESSTGSAVAFSAGNKIVSDGVPFLRIPTVDGDDDIAAAAAEDDDVVKVWRRGSQRWANIPVNEIAAAGAELAEAAADRAEEAAANAAVGYLSFELKSDMELYTSALDNQTATVWGDTTANNGIYSWDDGGSAWVYQSENPNQRLDQANRQIVTMAADPFPAVAVKPAARALYTVTQNVDPADTFTRADIQSYFDALGVMQTVATGIPAFEYDPITGAYRGIRNPPSRINNLRNAHINGAVAGTPGTPPTNWTVTTGASLSSEIVGVGTENGIRYLDVRIFGTASAGTIQTINLESTTQISAATATTRTLSAFVKLVSGSTAGLSLLQLGLRENTSGGTQVVSNLSESILSDINSGPLSRQFFSYTVEFSGGGTVARSYPRIVLTPVSGQAVNITLRIGAPQEELGGNVSPFIDTTGSAVTRAVSTHYRDITGLVGDDEVTIRVRGRAGELADGFVFGLCDAAGDNRHQFIMVVRQLHAQTIVADAVTADINLGYLAPGVLFSAAYSASTSDFKASLNGEAAKVDTLGAMPTGCIRAYVGMDPDGNHFDGWIEGWDIFPRPLGEDDLRTVSFVGRTPDPILNDGVTRLSEVLAVTSGTPGIDTVDGAGNALPVDRFPTANTRFIAPWDVVFGITYGQSWARGGGGSTDITLSVAVPGGLMLGAIRPDDAGGGAYTSMNPLIESVGGGGGETPCAGQAHAFRYMMQEHEGETTVSQEILVASTGLGGTRADELASGTTPHTRTLDAIAAGGTLCDAADKTFGVGYVTWWQGAADQNTTTDPWAYESTVRGILDDFQTKAREVQGGQRTVPMFMIQMSDHRVSSATYRDFPKNALALHRLSLEEERFILSTPSYIFPRRGVGDVHNPGLGYFWAGCYLGFHWYLLQKGTRHRPLSMKSMELQGRFAIIELDNYTGTQVVFDDDQVVAIDAGRGVRLIETTTGGAISIVSAAIVGKNFLRLETASTLPPNVIAQAGFNGDATTGTGPINGARTQIRNTRTEIVEDISGTEIADAIAAWNAAHPTEPQIPYPLTLHDYLIQCQVGVTA